MSRNIIKTGVNKAFQDFNNDLDIKKLVQSIADIADYSIRCQSHKLILNNAIKEAYLLSDWELIKKYAEKEGYITNLWGIADVKETAKTYYEINLTDDQAWDILYCVGKYHDAEYGINWDSIRCQIDIWLDNLTEEERSKIPVYEEEEN